MESWQKKSKSTPKSQKLKPNKNQNSPTVTKLVEQAVGTIQDQEKSKNSIDFGSKNFLRSIKWVTIPIQKGALNTLPGPLGKDIMPGFLSLDWVIREGTKIILDSVGQCP